MIRADASGLGILHVLKMKSASLVVPTPGWPAGARSRPANAQLPSEDGIEQA